MKFTVKSIEALKPRDNRYEQFENGSKGFGIRISPSGTKSWISRYRLNGHLTKLTLGNYPILSLANARIEHQKIRTMLHNGMDPQAEKQEIKAAQIEAPTLLQLVDSYLENYAKPNKKSWKDDRRRLKYITKEYGKLKDKDITRRHITSFIDKEIARGTSTGANRVFASIRGLFNWAIRKGIIETNPCSQIGNPTKEKARDRVLSENEIKMLWNNLPKTDMPINYQYATKLLLITAQRKIEVLSIEKSEIDLRSKFWTIPSHKAKNGQSHRVPLSTLAIDAIEKAIAYSNDSKWLFPALSSEERHIPENTLNQRLCNNKEIIRIEDFIPHDLRRTAASYMASSGIPRLVISKILNHIERDVTAVYDRHSYDKEKRDALVIWSKQLETIIN